MGMQLEIEEEYNQFLEGMKEKGFVFGAYMDETEYEDEYSHNEINEAMGILKRKIIDYLHENRPNEFIVYSDWCVHVLTVDKAKQLCLPKITIEMRMVK